MNELIWYFILLGFIMVDKLHCLSNCAMIRLMSGEYMWQKWQADCCPMVYMYGLSSEYNLIPTALQVYRDSGIDELYLSPPKPSMQ
jgi:hypothetical protein